MLSRANVSLYKYFLMLPFTATPISPKLDLIQDPLEQFNPFTFFIVSSDLRVLSLYIDKCPFNIIKMVHNLGFIVFNIVNTVYAKICTLFLIIFPTPTYLVFVWSVLLSILIIVIITDKTITLIQPATAQLLTTRSVTVFLYLIRGFSFIAGSVLKSNTTLRRNEYFSIIFFLFAIILLCNTFGLLPYTFTLTSSFIVTFFLAATHYIAINIIGAFHKKWKFANLFLPSGVPLVIGPFLVLVEFVSYLAKVLSLSIRLFANMMSGHALLKILIGFSWTMATSGNYFMLSVSVTPWLLVTGILFLEGLIAFLQAYVFVILVAIYLNDVVDMH